MRGGLAVVRGVPGFERRAPRRYGRLGQEIAGRKRRGDSFAKEGIRGAALGQLDVALEEYREHRGGTERDRRISFIGILLSEPGVEPRHVLVRATGVPTNRSTSHDDRPA